MPTGNPEHGVPPMEWSRAQSFPPFPTSPILCLETFFLVEPPGQGPAFFITLPLFFPPVSPLPCMATHSSVLAWESQGRGGLVGCRLWGRTESDTTEAT